MTKAIDSSCIFMKWAPNSKSDAAKQKEDHGGNTFSQYDKSHRIFYIYRKNRIGNGDLSRIREEERERLNLFGYSDI